MAILDSIKGRFDESIKADKVNTLQALIFASSNVEKYKLKTKDESVERDRYDKLTVRVIEAFDLYRLEGRNSYGGEKLEDALVFLSGQYDDKQKDDLKKKFQKNYQDGGALGIWIDKDLRLSPLAKRVANHEITISRYLSIAFLNIFSYRTNNGIPTYFHVLERLLDYFIDKGNDDLNIDYSTFKQIYFNFEDDGDQHREPQAKALFQYLVGTEYFVQVDNKLILAVDPRWKGKLELLKSFCNNDFENLSFKDAQEQFDNRKNRDQYAKVIGNTKFEKEIAKISEGLDTINETINKKTEQTYYSNIPYPKQLIFSGAPGTGKSYQLNRLANKYFRDTNNTYYKRVTFHPNMNYGHFVGVYKLAPTNNELAPITYKFVPGILLQQLVEAYKNPQINYLVLVEEINRANTAMVFGDAFQLLDRTNGISDYPISISEDIRVYLEEQKIIGESSNINEEIKEKLQIEGLFFPNNLFIWASMNEADQGVLPMDTAFKRRWSFEKFDVNDLGENGETFFKDKYIRTKDCKVNWNQLRIAINNKLLELNVPEGKLLGPYFISKEMMESEEEITKAFETKVLMYLFEDAVKTRVTSLFDIENSEKHYGALINKFKQQGIKIFKDINLSEAAIELIETPNITSIDSDEQ